MRSILLAVLFATLGASAASPGANAPAVTVHIRGFAFVPAVVRVVPGTAVRFVNDDSEAHTVTSSDKRFDSGGLDTNDAWTHVFSAVGTYAYFCALHPYMKGSVVVVKAGTGALMQPVPGTAPKPGPLALPADRLLHPIGYRSVELHAGAAATHDVTLG